MRGLEGPMEPNRPGHRPRQARESSLCYAWVNLTRSFSSHCLFNTALGGGRLCQPHTHTITHTYTRTLCHSHTHSVKDTKTHSIIHTYIATHKHTHINVYKPLSILFCSNSFQYHNHIKKTSFFSSELLR